MLCGDTSPQLSPAVLEFSLKNRRAPSVQLQVARKKALTVVCAYVPNSSSEYPAFTGWSPGKDTRGVEGNWEEWPDHAQACVDS